MHPLYKELLEYFEDENKNGAVKFVMKKLEKGALDIVTLYNELLAPSLNNMKCEGPEEYCIWKEHVRSSIVRSIIEMCYPYVIHEREVKYKNTGKGKKVIVICPPEELHEIGPRMIADFFTLVGYDVTFIGANTPKKSFLSAIDILEPVYIALSVTNYYNLSAARAVIDDIKKQEHNKFKIIVGGRAFERNPNIYKEIGADVQLKSFEDIQNLEGGD
jgi:methanogenic corrinoid protein MtbC1